MGALWLLESGIVSNEVGKIYSYTPESLNAVSDTNGELQSAVGCADAAAVVFAANNADNNAFNFEITYYDNYVMCRKHYKYGVANDDDFC